MPQVQMLVSMAASSWSVVPGDVMEVTEEVEASWVENGIAKAFKPPEQKVIEHVNEPAEEEPAEEPKEEAKLESLGGGWYLLPNGEKVHGKAEAQEAFKKLNG